MIFKIYNSDFGVKVNGQSYYFDHVDSLVIDDPESNKLTRGANASNKVGLAYKEGVKDPKKWTVKILGMTTEIKTLLDQCYVDQTRVDVFCIDRGDGSSKTGRDCVLSQQPQQLQIDETPESLATDLIFETFNPVEVFKS